MLGKLAACSPRHGHRFGLASGVFAAIYVPLRWRQIKDLPRNIRLLGLIGGFGLIAILVICLAAGGISFYLRDAAK